MARQNANAEEFAINQGPSKLDLMLALFDTDMGTRTVRFQFQLVELVKGARAEWAEWYDVQIISARRRHPSATVWDIEGTTEIQGGEKRISIYYLSDTRKGRMAIEGELRTHDVMEMPSDAQKARALTSVIEKMIARYQDSHRGNLGGLDEEIFKLFEKAKRLMRAKNQESLDEAVKDI